MHGRYYADVLGLPPVWYKSAPYRAKAVRDPRGVLADFGVTLPDRTRIRVWDSTAEIRYLVIPMRPAGTDGSDGPGSRLGGPPRSSRPRIQVRVSRCCLVNF